MCVCVTPQNAVDNVRIVLVGNKIDLENQREVSEKRGKKVNYIAHVDACIESWVRILPREALFPLKKGGSGCY